MLASASVLSNNKEVIALQIIKTDSALTVTQFSQK